MTYTCRGPVDLPPLETPHQLFDRTGLAPSPSTHRGLHPLPHTMKHFLPHTSPLPPLSLPRVSPAPALSAHPTLLLNQASALCPPLTRPCPSTKQAPCPIAQECRPLHPPPMATSPASFRRPVSRAITVWFISLASACTARAATGAPPCRASDGETYAPWVYVALDASALLLKQPNRCSQSMPALPPSMKADAAQAASRNGPLGARLRDANVPTPADRTTLTYCSTSLPPPRLLRRGVHPPHPPARPPRAEGWGGPRCLHHPRKQLPRRSQNLLPLSPSMQVGQPMQERRGQVRYRAPFSPRQR